MADINIYGIKDAANILVKTKSDGKPFLYADYATEVVNDWKHDSVYAMSKSVRAIRWDHNKQSTLKMTMEIFDLKWLSLLTGSKFAEGVKAIQKRDVLTVQGGKVTLKATPKTGSLVIYALAKDSVTNLEEQVVGTPSTDSNTYSISGLQVTLNATSCPDGSDVVAYYLSDSDADAQNMIIQSDGFPEQVEIFADAMIRDTDGQDKFVQIHYFNAKAMGNFTLTLSSTAVTKLEITFDLFKASDSSDMAEFTIL